MYKCNVCGGLFCDAHYCVGQQRAGGTTIWKTTLRPYTVPMIEKKKPLFFPVEEPTIADRMITIIEKLERRLTRLERRAAYR